MRLNCKRGDLAFYAGSVVADLGKVVTVVRPYDVFEGRVYWVIEPPLMGGGKKHWLCADDLLIPIRDSDGEDEMIRIAGLPNKEPSNV